VKTASSSDAGIAALWREFYGPLHDYLRRRMVSDADADDILQEVFLRVHRQISTLHDTSKLQGWVYRITRNALIDHIRARKSQPEASLPGEGIEDSSGPGGDGIDLAQSLRRFVAELPELYREALVRHEFEGQSIRELAHSLGISETAAKSRVRRARLLVRGMLDRCCQFEFDRRGRVIDAVARNGSCLSGSSGERVGCECSSRR
jgi:RNA polymerase sigma-70 factor (ECF subfamily)